MKRGLIVADGQNDFCDGGSVPAAGGARIAIAIAGMVEQKDGGVCQIVVATRDHPHRPGRPLLRYRAVCPGGQWA